MLTLCRFSSEERQQLCQVLENIREVARRFEVLSEQKRSTDELLRFLNEDYYA